MHPRGDKRLASKPFVKGKITYADGSRAELIYINTVVVEGLSEDIYSYRRINPKFPDQTTIDQFFDEMQFEAYRELGCQIGSLMCRDLNDLSILNK